MPRVLPLLLVCCLAGCNSAQLQFSTLRQSRTTPDLLQLQVLDNLARLSADPGLLPYFDLVSVGTTAVTDRGAASLGISSAVREITGVDYGADAERAIAGNWTISPTNDPNRLAAIRAACLIALGREEEIVPLDQRRLDTFLALNYPNYAEGSDPHTVIPSGWLCVGGKRDRPRHRQYVSRRDDVYVWVKDGRLQDLANFSLIILDIATLHPDLPVREGSTTAPEGGGEAARVARTRTAESIVELDKQNALLQKTQERLAAPTLDAATPEQKAAREAKLAEIRDAISNNTLDRQALVHAQTRSEIERLNFETTQTRRAAAAASIPGRLNGPAFNNGLFLIPRP